MIAFEQARDRILPLAGVESAAAEDCVFAVPVGGRAKVLEDVRVYIAKLERRAC